MTDQLMERTDYTLITEGVRENEQTLSIYKPFWVMFVANIGIGAWLMGVILAGVGLSFYYAVLLIFLATVVGSALPAGTSILGPLTRLSQMEASRYSLGRKGKVVPAFMNWVGAIGWDVVNNVFSTSAVVAFFAAFGCPVPFWLALAGLVAIQMIIGIYGHHLVQEASHYTGVIMGLIFMLVGFAALHTTGITMASGKSVEPKDAFSVFALLVAFNAGGWTTYTADYTRYLPQKTPSYKVFLCIFLGLFLSLFALTLFGYLTASLVSEATPAGIMSALQRIAGPFAPFVLLLVAFTSIPLNAINDNSAAYSLTSAGLNVSRPTLAAAGAVFGYVVCLLATDSFIDTFENFLLLFLHWVFPWASILLVHWYMIGRKQQKAPSGITIECAILVGVSVASFAMFSSNTLYNGFLSDAVYGVDIGPYVGFVVAGLLTWGVCALRNAGKILI